MNLPLSRLALVMLENEGLSGAVGSPGVPADCTGDLQFLQSDTVWLMNSDSSDRRANLVSVKKLFRQGRVTACERLSAHAEAGGRSAERLPLTFALCNIGVTAQPVIQYCRTWALWRLAAAGGVRLSGCRCLADAAEASRCSALQTVASRHHRSDAPASNWGEQLLCNEIISSICNKTRMEWYKTVFQISDSIVKLKQIICCFVAATVSLQLLHNNASQPLTGRGCCTRCSRAACPSRCGDMPHEHAPQLTMPFS